MKKIKKLLLLLLIICIVLIPSLLTYLNQKKEEEKAQIGMLGYTEHELTEGHIRLLYIYFDICPPEYREPNFYEKYTYSLKKKELILEPGAESEARIKYLNELMFANSKGKNLKKEAEKYGFNAKEPITLEWILENPYETLLIISKDSLAMGDLLLNWDCCE